MPNNKHIAGPSSVYRVHWLKAKARYDRWNEEVILIPHEMVWTTTYFNRQSALWQRRAETAQLENLFGHSAYALRQKSIWEKFSSQAKISFSNFILP
jgi:hypothetical protein